MLAVDAVAEVLEAAAKTPHRTISHNLLSLLHKLALQAPDSAATQIEPDGALRRNVARLISGWELDDPNPGEYTAILQGMVREMPEVGPYQSNTRCDPEVIVGMAVDVDGVGPAVVAAAEALAANGRRARLAALLDAAPDGAAARNLWPRSATEERLREALGRDTPDHTEVGILASHLGPGARSRCSMRLSARRAARNAPRF
jgi:hypothetical protein